MQLERCTVFYEHLRTFCTQTTQCEELVGLKSRRENEVDAFYNSCCKKHLLR